MPKAVIQVICVDMDEKVQDVVGVIHMVAESPQDAEKKAITMCNAQGITKQGGKYYFQIMVLGPLPSVGPQVLVPRIELPKGVDLRGAAGL